MSNKMLAAAAAAVLLAGPALADTTTQASTTTKVVVRTAGVDFNDRAQVQAFFHHINAIATRACATPSNADLAAYVPTSEKEACVNEAVANAVRTLNKPVLTAYYDASPDAANRALAGNDQ